MKELRHGVVQSDGNAACRQDQVGVGSQLPYPFYFRRQPFRRVADMAEGDAANSFVAQQLLKQLSIGVVYLAVLPFLTGHDEFPPRRDEEHPDVFVHGNRRISHGDGDRYGSACQVRSLG